MSNLPEQPFAARIICGWGIAARLWIGVAVWMWQRLENRPTHWQLLQSKI